MAEIVNRLKEKIRAGGGSTEGIRTIDEAVRALPESGGGSSSGGVFKVTASERGQDVVLDATFNEIKAALENGQIVYTIYTRIHDEMVYEVVLALLMSIGVRDDGEPPVPIYVVTFDDLEPFVSSDPDGELVQREFK